MHKGVALWHRFVPWYLRELTSSIYASNVVMPFIVLFRFIDGQ